jgi:DNA-binding CsgD family transcriptional regulator
VEYDLPDDWRPAYTELLSRYSSSAQIPSKVFAQAQDQISLADQDRTPSCSILFDLPRALTVRVSSGLKHLLGIDPSDWENRPMSLVHERIHPEDQVRLIELHQLVADTLSAPTTRKETHQSIHTVRLVHASGDPVWVHSVTIPLYIEPNTGIMLVSLASFTETLPPEGGRARCAVRYETITGQRIYQVLGEKTETKLNLSARELSVLRLLAQGKTSNEIGALLEISRESVNKHRRRLLERTNTTNSAELVRVAIEQGLI